MAWVLLGVLVGFMVPWQTVANNRLRSFTGTPYSASLISFAVGTAGLLAVCFALGELPDATLAAVPAWMWLGGAFGVVALTGNILLYPRLGAVETVVLPIAGQILIGLAIDQFGWFRAPIQQITPLRGLGAALVMAGVLACVGRPQGPAHHTEASAWGWRGAGVVFGALIASQAAVNGQLGAALGSPIPAALVSFAVGTALLLAVNLALRWRLPREQVTGNPWWMWCGGFIGAAYVLTNATLAPRIGTGLTVMAGLAGLMAGSLIVDRATGRGVRATQLFGVALILAGVAAMRVL